MTDAPALREELDGLFTGGLSHCRGLLVTPDDDRPFRPASDLLDPGTLEAILDRFAAVRGDADRRAVASLWSQWYVGALVPPSVAAGQRLGRILPLAADEVGVVLDDETGQPAAFRLPGEGRVDRAAGPWERFRGLLRGHVGPLVRTLAPLVGLSPDTVWTNAGRYVQWILDEIEPSPDAEPSVPSARPLLEAECRPDGSANPLHDTIRYVEEGGRRVARRRVCCLQYLLPELEGCGALCPLPHVRGGSAGPA